MTKCDFCTQSDSQGKCYWNFRATREQYCEEAIKKMIEAFKNIGNKQLK